MYDPGMGIGEQGSRGEGEFSPSFIPNSPTQITQNPTGSRKLAGRELVTDEVTDVADESLSGLFQNINSKSGETPNPQEFLQKSGGVEIEYRDKFAKEAAEISSQAISTSSADNALPNDYDSLTLKVYNNKRGNQSGIGITIRENLESNPIRQERLSATYNSATVMPSPNQEETRLREEIGAMPESTQPELKQKLPNSSSGKDEQMERLPITNYPSPIPNYQFPIPQTIRVSIGRIEVRAIPAPPAPPAPRKSPPTPKLSLSEYLRKTGGGG
jgi:hypothetical protein